jgi:hypothetical protein
MRKRKPELVAVKVVPWDEAYGFYGLLSIFDDGESVSELWGNIKETEMAAAIRRKDIRVISPRSMLR